MISSTAIGQSRIGRLVSRSALRDPGSLFAIAVCSFLVYNQVLRAGFPPPLPNACMTVPLVVNICLFLLRRDPVRTGTAFDALIAVLGSFSISFMPAAPNQGLAVLVLLATGLALWLWALFCLGRSFGIAPADRGLKTGGPYRYIRHPVYAGELLTALGVVVAGVTPEAILASSIWWLLQCWRMVREEKVLGGYEDYQARVRWRVVPGVW